MIRQNYKKQFLKLKFGYNFSYTLRILSHLMAPEEKHVLFFFFYAKMLKEFNLINYAYASRMFLKSKK